MWGVVAVLRMDEIILGMGNIYFAPGIDEAPSQLLDGVSAGIYPSREFPALIV